MPHCGVVGARIHYEVNGEGEPLVLIAGTAFDLSFWQDLLPEPRHCQLEFVSTFY